MYDKIKVIAFDADDTLWVNETYFREAERQFAKLLSAYETENKINQELYKTEIKNLDIYGYGVKGFVLSMVECALSLSNNTINPKLIDEILLIGKDMLSKPIVLLDGIREVLEELYGKYRLVLATKGDLLDQQNKLDRSGLTKYFHHIEVMTNKKIDDYSKLIGHLDITPGQFLMIGNSLKSDVIPVVNIGAKAIHVPFHTTWEHEQVTPEEENNCTYKTVNIISEILPFL